jgi:hypothetical protein
MRGARWAVRSACATGLALMLSACASSPPPRGEWQPLFDGVSTRGWHNAGKATLDPRWQAIDGALVLTAPGGGDIVSEA